MSNWIKMRSNLWDDPRVMKLCDLTHKREAEVIGGLYWMWSMADGQSTDGHLDGLSLGAIDRKTGVKGLGAALAKVGWITEVEDGVEIARFDEHNGASAKRRAEMAKASSKYRASSSKRHHSDMTDGSREYDLDKNRIDNTPIVPNGDMVLEGESVDLPAPEDQILSRFRELFHIRPTSTLDASTTKAYQKNKKAAAELSDEDWRALEWVYRQQEGVAATYRRKDLATLLNNLTSEVQRAYDWAGRSGVSFALVRVAVESEPEGWASIITDEDPSYNCISWAALPDSMKRYVREKIRQRHES